MKHDDFDAQFEQMRRRGTVGAIVSAVGTLAAVSAIVYVAWHFLAKVW
jgi:hypothetical protein